MKKQASYLRRAVQARGGSSGFTLIEVMIVVAVIGILAAVAIPAYNDYIRRGQLPEAFNALSEYGVKMEQYYQDNRNYGSSTDCASAASASGWNTFPTTIKYFTFSCATGTASGDTTQQSYTITATGASGQAIGHTYTINEKGLRKTIKFKNTTVNQSCWLSKSTSC